MAASDLGSSADPQRFAEAIRAGLRETEEAGGHAHEGPGGAAGERRATHRGHRIVVRTSYEVSVDGRPVTGQLMVGDRGQVIAHSLPNYSFSSALDLVRELIDAFPEDFPGGDGEGQGSGPADEQSHGHGGGAPP